MYYKTNAIYQAIENARPDNFAFVSGNQWQLVYGDNDCVAKLVVHVFAVAKNEMDNPNYQAGNLLRQCSNVSDIPMAILKFPIDEEEVNEVSLSLKTGFERIKMSELSERFKEFGLPVSNSPTSKYLNDKTSSAYHKWQRQSLGSSLTVSDIDLWKANTDGSPEIIYELKRSYIPLDSWKPYPDDYRNFRLLSDFAKRSKIGFSIVYNVRKKFPSVNDDPSIVTVFDVDFEKNPPIVKRGQYSFEQFLKL